MLENTIMFAGTNPLTQRIIKYIRLIRNLKAGTDYMKIKKNTAVIILVVCVLIIAGILVLPRIKNIAGNDISTEGFSLSDVRIEALNGGNVYSNTIKVSDKYPGLKAAVDKIVSDHNNLRTCYEISRFDETVLSFTYNRSSGVWYNMTLDGTELDKSSITKDDASYEEFKRFVSSYITSNASGAYSLMMEDVQRAVDNFDNMNWHMDVGAIAFEVDIENNLDFTVYISYEELKDFLKPEYIPGDGPVFGELYGSSVSWGDNTLSVGISMASAYLDSSEVVLNGQAIDYQSYVKNNGVSLEDSVFDCEVRYLYLSANEVYLYFCIVNNEGQVCTFVYNIASGTAGIPVSTSGEAIYSYDALTLTDLIELQ